LDTIGQRISYVRHFFGFSQEEFASIMQVNTSYISMLENNKNQPSDMFISLLSAEFNISIEWLRTGKEPLRTELDIRLKKEKARYALETGIGFETVGKRIRFARIYREIPASVLNKMLTTTKDDYLLALENDKKKPTTHDIEAITKNVGASEEWLLTGSGKVGFLELDGLFSPKEESEVQDKELNDIIQGIKLFWKQSKEDVRTWFKLQFRRTFPEIEDFQKKHVEMKDENAVTGAFPQIAEEIKKGDDESGGQHE
jgi:transcriptional regulator with XRE-family HTH domain